MCGREPGGARVKELGVCVAASNGGAEGLHGGKQRGRVCWAIAGTLCEGKVQGVFALKYDSCLQCRFYNLVNLEEGKNKLSTSEILLLLKEQEEK